MPRPSAHRKSVSIERKERVDFAPQTKMFGRPTNCRCFALSTKSQSVKSKNGLGTSLTASTNGNSDALARPNDSMTSAASVALRQRWSFLFKDLELAFTLRDFVYSYSARFVTSSTPYVQTQGTQARRAQVCEKKQDWSLDDKCGSWTRETKASRQRRLREKSDVPCLLFTCVIVINQYYVNLSFYQHAHHVKAINRYYVTSGVYKHYVIAIHQYYIILSILRKLHYTGIT